MRHATSYVSQAVCLREVRQVAPPRAGLGDLDGSGLAGLAHGAVGELLHGRPYTAGALLEGVGGDTVPLALGGAGGAGGDAGAGAGGLSGRRDDLGRDVDDGLAWVGGSGGGGGCGCGSYDWCYGSRRRRRRRSRSRSCAGAGRLLLELARAARAARRKAGEGDALEQLGDAFEGADVTRIALGGAGSPADQAVGNVSGVAVRSTTGAEVPARRDRARVVHAGRNIVLAVVRGAGLLDQVSQAGAARATRDPVGAVLDHLGDLRGRARVLDDAVVVASALAIVALHETRVPDATVGGVDADAAIALLHDDREDESRVDVGGRANAGDGGLEVVILLVGVVGQRRVEALARLLQDWDIGSEPERCISTRPREKNSCASTRGKLTSHRNLGSTA